MSDDQLTIDQSVKVSRITKNRSIIIVDDKQYLRSILTDIFDTIGYSVHNFKDGLSAMQFLENHHFNSDLIISDLHCPKLPGADLARNIRKFRNKEELPIIMLTSTFKRKEDIDELNECNINYFLYTCTPIEDILYVANQLLFPRHLNIRETPRHWISCPIHFRIKGSNEKWIQGTALNINDKGVFLKTDSDIRVNSQMDLDIQFHGGNDALLCTGTVIRTFKKNYQPESLKLTGAGLLFENLSVADRRKIQNYLEEFKSKN